MPKTSKAEKLADFYLYVFHDRKLEDVPETVPPLSGELTRDDCVWRAQKVLDFLDDLEPTETGDAWDGGFAENH